MFILFDRLCWGGCLLAPKDPVGFGLTGPATLYGLLEGALGDLGEEEEAVDELC